jgi:tetratricopeptide (TPR) repeat protein
MPDGEKIVVKSAKDAVTILNPAIDVAVIRFTSNKNYAVATIGNYTTRGKQWLLMTGFPGKDQSKQRLLTAGTVKGKDEAAFNTKYQSSLDNGNELVYTNQSSRGMSGGGVFDTEGRLVGVNTASEDEILGGKEVSWGYSLGVPITTFLGIAEAAKFSTQNFPKVANPAVEVNAKEIEQVKAQLFRFQVPKSGAEVADWVNYGNALWRAGENTEAVIAFDQAITLLGKEGKGENLANIYYSKGLALASFGDGLVFTNFQKATEKREEGLKAFQQATSTFPQFPNAWRKQGEMLRTLKRYPEALIAYDYAIDKGEKTDFVPYVERGSVLLKLERYPEALVSYKRAINLKPTHPWAYTGRGILYFLNGEKELALKDFNETIKLNPTGETAYNNRGNLYKDKGEKELALQDYNQAIKLNPTGETAYNNRGLFYAENGEKELALQDLNQAIKLDPQSADAYNNRGNLYKDKGKKELALKDFNQAIKVNPTGETAYNNRGALYAKSGEKELALKDFNQAIKLNPRFAGTYNNRGLLYAKNGEKELALKDYNQAIKFNPQYESAYNNRGLLYAEEGEKELALQDFNQAIKLDPQRSSAYHNRGLLYFEKKEKELALQDFNQAIKIDTQDPRAYFYRGVIYSQKSERELALQDLNQAIKLNPQDPRAYYHRGFVYLTMNNPQQAIPDLKIAAKLYYEQGNPAYQPILQLLNALKN